MTAAAAAARLEPGALARRCGVHRAVADGRPRCPTDLTADPDRRQNRRRAPAGAHPPPAITRRGVVRRCALRSRRPIGVRPATRPARRGRGSRSPPAAEPVGGGGGRRARGRRRRRRRRRVSAARLGRRSATRPPVAVQLVLVYSQPARARCIVAARAIVRPWLVRGMAHAVAGVACPGWRAPGCHLGYPSDGTSDG